MLNRVLEKAGINREEAFVVNALLCQPTDSPPKKEALNACRDRLAEEVLASPRRVILAMGNSSVRALLGDHNFKITSKRGIPIDLEELGIVLPTVHPAAVLRNVGDYPRWLADVEYAGKLLRGGQAALKHPPKPTAHVILADPNEETHYARTSVRADSTPITRKYGEGAPAQPRLRDWPKIEVTSGIPLAIQAVDFLLAQPKLSADIETGESYSPRLGKVICLSVAWSPTEAIVFSEGLIDNEFFRKHLRRLLSTPGPEWVGHNWNGYDADYNRNYILDKGWPSEGAIVEAHDTLLEHYCLDETKGTHDLESLSRDLLGAEDYKFVVRGMAYKGIGYEHVPREILYPYAALDTCHTFSIHEILCPQIKASKSLSKMYFDLLLPASRFLMRVQDHGLWVDQEFMQSLDKELSAKIEEAFGKLGHELEDKILDLYPLGRSHEENEELGPTDRGYLWDPELYVQSQWATKKAQADWAKGKTVEYNARNFRHTSYALYRLIGWVPMNTNERTLRDLDQTGKDQSATFGYKAKNYARGHPNRKQVLNYQYIQALIDVRLAQQAYNQLVGGVRKAMEPDGRLHTTFKMTATETGRLSSTNPNLQNLPVPEKDDPRPARNIVGAPPGRLLIEADYSQVELRLLAHFSNDANLIDVYRTGRDLHTELSIAIWGDRVFDEEGKQIGGYTNYQRVRAKAVNFGIAYGRGAGSIAAEHDIPEEDAEEMRQSWFRTFSGAAKWLDEIHKAPLQGRTVITAFGRRRRFGVVSRDNYVGLSNQSANFPMQSTASDLTLFSAMRVQAKWDRTGLDAHVVCLVHDAIVVEAEESVAQQAADELRAIMADTPKRVLNPVIDFPVDVHIGHRWGTLKLEEMTETKTSAKSDTFGKAGVASGRL